MRRLLGFLLVGALAAPAVSLAYPGGTPSFQTDAAPYCAGCHSSRSEAALAGTGERAAKEVAERKHLSVLLSGQKGYASLTEADRRALADQIRALDEASTVTLAAPAALLPGQSFDVRVDVTGGAGPVVGIALVDRDHRWFARPATAAGWRVIAPPKITGPDGSLQTEWLARRPEGFDRNISYVNVEKIASDSAAKSWSKASVVFTLRAPDHPGVYPLAAVFLYGTEKSSVLGYTTDPVGMKEPRGGLTGGSGRVLFTPVQSITVKAAAEPKPPAPPVLQ
jgi:hypothetical protein